MKKLFAFILAIALCVSVTACGNRTNQSTTENTQAGEPASTASEATNPVSREDEASSLPSESSEDSQSQLEAPQGEDSAAVEPSPVASNEPPATANEQKILIAYFTWAENTVVANPSAVDVDATTSASVLPPGNTAVLAGWIQQEVDGDLFSIVVTEPYSSDYDECLDRAADEKAANARPALTARVENMDDYDVIFLGYPNWWYTVPMAIHTFLEDYDLSGKTVIPFCAHGTGGLASSVRDIRSALPNSTVLEPIGVYRPDTMSSQGAIISWLDGLGY